MFTVRVNEVVRHNEDTATITFNHSFRSFPGQFVMLNAFGLEEIPLSLSAPNSVTVKAIGDTTRAMVNSEKGDLMGVKGPIGRPFSLPQGSALFIAGGIGVAPLRYLHNFLQALDIDVHVLYGDRAASNLLFLDELVNADISTDDGSKGFHGNVVDLLKSENQDFCHSFSKIYCCGPEVMLKNLFTYFEELNVLTKVEFALERYMRCGLGVCGSCSLEDGSMVCSDGPVFRGVKLNW
ncbi:MAG: dihydroorotate dehydrogenase electron transfer subunit [Archaeoglobaceae archaeon]